MGNIPIWGNEPNRSQLHRPPVGGHQKPVNYILNPEFGLLGRYDLTRSGMGNQSRPEIAPFAGTKPVTSKKCSLGMTYWVALGQ